MKIKLIDTSDEVGFEGLSDKKIKSIDHMSHLTNGRILIDKAWLIPMDQSMLKPNKEIIVEKLVELVEYLDTPISTDTLLKVLYNIRKKQYYANPEKYPFGLSEFCKIFLMSCWSFEGTPQENLALEFASTSKERGRIRINQTVRYAKETDMFKGVQQVKLAKILRRVYEQKTIK